MHQDFIFENTACLVRCARCIFHVSGYLLGIIWTMRILKNINSTLKIPIVVITTKILRFLLKLDH